MHNIVILVLLTRVLDVIQGTIKVVLMASVDLDGVLVELIHFATLLKYQENLCKILPV